MQEELTKVLDNCFGIDERSVGFLPTYETVEQEKAQQAHHYAGIDESGYFSSISSLYEVPSTMKITMTTTRTSMSLGQFASYQLCFCSSLLLSCIVINYQIVTYQQWPAKSFYVH